MPIILPEIEFISVRRPIKQGKIDGYEYLICNGTNMGRWTTQFGVHCLADTADCKGFARNIAMNTKDALLIYNTFDSDKRHSIKAGDFWIATINEASKGNGVYPETHWNGEGINRDKRLMISKLIPNKGECDTDILNLYRTMSNLYYDLYNNGLCNKDVVFPDFKKYLLMFADKLKPLLRGTSTYVRMKNPSKKHYGEFEDMYNAIITYVYDVVYGNKED